MNQGYLLSFLYMPYYKKCNWSRAFNRYTIAQEIDLINQCMLWTLSYHVKFKVCVVSNPLICVVIS